MCCRSAQRPGVRSKRAVVQGYATASTGARPQAVLPGDRVIPATATFHYLVNVCRLHMKRKVTACVQPSRWKRESALLYTSCAPVRRTTIANSFGLGRSTVNELYREVCRAIVPVLERNWVKMVSAAELPDHIREFQAALEFPQGMRALDGCHFSVSPPNVNASDYHNKGW